MPTPLALENANHVLETLHSTAAISDLNEKVSRVEIEMMRNTLRDVVTSLDDLTGLRYATAPTCCAQTALGRTLLWGAEGARVSLWAFRWPVGVSTPIHDHHCACVFSVHTGTLQERFYRRSDCGHAIETSRKTRKAGAYHGLSVASRAVHSMHNVSDETAYSLHLYAFDPASRENSIQRCFELI